MTEIIEYIDKTQAAINSSIEKCETHCYIARGNAADLRNNGFLGTEIAELIKNLEMALKNAHMYQAYINTQDN